MKVSVRVNLAKLREASAPPATPQWLTGMSRADWQLALESAKSMASLDRAMGIERCKAYPILTGGYPIAARLGNHQDGLCTSLASFFC